MHLFIHSFAQLIAIPMRDMVLPGMVGILKFLHQQTALCNQPCHPNKLLLGVPLVLIFQPTDRLAVGGDVGMKAQEADAVFEREYLCLPRSGTAPAFPDMQ